MRKLLLLVALCVATATAATAEENGLLRKQSPHSVADTAERLEQAARDKGMKVFPRFDHAAAASEYDKTMPPAVVVSFGNPAYGTPFMIKNPASGIDFPPKAVVYEDQDGQVWLAYNSSNYLYETIFKRHDLDYEASDVDFYANVLEELTDYAIAPEE